MEGSFYVDRRCINCDACRQIAPRVFRNNGEHAYVFQQPSEDTIENALQALISCPAEAIGTKMRFNYREVETKFPIPISENVYFCGFHSPRSFGAHSYFLQTASGNILVDSPRYTGSLIQKFEKMGGIDFIFLTHRDDVGDASKYAVKFKAKRVIHDGDKDALPDAELIIETHFPVQLMDDVLIIPTPGHTEGHMVLLYNNYLFTGDHLFWSIDTHSLRASRKHCWYDWDLQIKSMEKLLNYEFEWVLPGHGQRTHMEKGLMKRQLETLIHKMKSPSYW